MHIVLVEPEIPQNTGNIARTCAAAGAVLHLVRPFGFSTSDRYLKRAGMDYWKLVDVRYHDSLDEVFNKNPESNFWFASTKSSINYADIKYGEDDFLVFGKETRGLPEELLAANYNKCIRIPMSEESRSLNLSNSVAIILYEALRQNGFDNLKMKGKLANAVEDS